MRSALRFEMLMAAVGIAVCGAKPAQAADATEVVDAVDGKDPYDATVDVIYGRTLRRAKITREFACNPRLTPDTCTDAWPGIGALVHAKELRYQRITHTLTPRLHLGIWHDLELRVDLPVVLSDEQEVRFAGNGGDPNAVAVDPTISSIAPDPEGPDDPQNLFDVPPKLPSRAGFGDMALTLKWSPFNQERDAARATWTLAMTWGLPTGDVMKPGNSGVGRGVHTFTFESAMSRRFGHAEPYFSLGGSVYAPSGDSLFKDYKFAQERIGPGPVARFAAGTEIIPFESEPEDRKYLKFVIDLGLDAEYHAEGRNYHELFDALAVGGRACALDPNTPLDANQACYNRDSNSELHGQPYDGIGTVEQFGALRGHLGLSLYASRFFRMGTELSLAHETEHFLSTADVGKDLDGSGLVESRQDAQNFNADEQNPTFVPAVDAVGRRLRVEETTVFTALFQASAIF